MTGAKRDEPLGSDLHAVIHKIEADILQNTNKNKIRNVDLTSRILQQNQSNYKGQYRTKVRVKICSLKFKNKKIK